MTPTRAPTLFQTIDKVVTMRLPILAACLVLAAYPAFAQNATVTGFPPHAGLNEQRVMTFRGADKPTLGNTLLGVKIVPQGTVSSPTDSWLNTIMINPDNLAQLGGGPVDGLEIFHQLGRHWKGSRDSLDVSLATSAEAHQTGTTFLTALRTTVAQFHSLGGNARAPIGDLYGANFNVDAAAPYPASTNGLEIDLQNEAAAIAVRRTVGVAVGYGPANEIQGTEDDTAFSVWVSPGGATARTVGPKNILTIGRSPNGAWPFVNGVGSIITTGQLSVGYGNGLSTPPNVATYGIDFSKVGFTSAAWWSPGYRVNGSGTVDIGAGEIAPTPRGIEIAAPGETGSVATVANPGSGYRRKDQLYDGLGGIIVIDRVSAGGAVLQAHYSLPPYAKSPPTNPVKTTGGSGNGAASFNLVWKRARQVQVGGAAINTVLGTGSPLPANATTGMMLVPTVAGTPSGVVGAKGNAALVVDTRDSKLCVNWGTGWKCTTLR